MNSLHLDMEIMVLIISGIIGGFIAGLLGLGGGIFYILVLPYAINWYNIPQDEASAFIVANSLFGIAFASATSLISDYKKLKLFLIESLGIAIPAVVASLLTTRFIVQSDWFSMEIFNVFVIVLMIYILIQLKIKRENYDSNPKLKLLPSSISGMASGCISALSGLGGGIIIIPLLQIKFRQSIKKAKLISLVVIFLSSAFVSLQNIFSKTIEIQSVNIQWGYILPIIAVPLVIGVFIGSPIGVRLSNKLNDKYLNGFFVLFVMIVLVEKLLLFF